MRPVRSDVLDERADPRSPRVPVVEGDLSDENDHWRSGFHVPGLIGRAETLVVYKNQLIVGGFIGFAGPTRVREIAAWDGRSWSQLGNGLSQDVLCSVVYKERLIVGGWFREADGVTVNYVAAWDGKSWSALGLGTNGSVGALTVYDGALIAAGTFTQAGGVEVNGIASWDGDSWSPLGEGITGTARALVEWNGLLVVGGYFSEAGGRPAKSIACWDGETWTALQGRTDSTVDCLAVYNGDLIVGGPVRYVWGAAEGIARWDGSSWHSLGGGLGGPLVPLALSMVVWDGKLVVGGMFDEAGGVAARRIAVWNGSGWNALGAGIGRQGDTQRVLAMAVFDGELHAAGSFAIVDDKPILDIARWDGLSWQSLDPPGLGLLGGVRALQVHDGNLFAAGAISHAGVRPVDRIARFDGDSWNTLGSGLNDLVWALAEHEGDVVAAGEFTEAGGAPANRVARWNGESWSPLGAGLDGDVYKLAVYDGDLIAGGAFTTSGGTPLNRIARWNGESWHPLGNGMNDAVWSLAVYEGKLIAGGWFTTAGEVQGQIAQWDGSSWSTLGAGVDLSVYALLSHEGSLFAGGNFWHADGTRVMGVARWDGNSWSALGAGLFGDFYPLGEVYALAVLGEDLFAGGLDLTFAGDFRFIARWDGNEWRTMGSTSSRVFALTEHDGSLFVGGSFALAGGKRSFGIARWDPVPVAIEVADFGGATTERGIGLHWRLSFDAQRELTGVRVDRSDASNGPFAERTEEALEPREVMYFEDSDVERGRTYWYRLRLVGANGNETIVGPLQVKATPIGQTVLHAPFETRNDGPIRIRYSIGPRRSVVALSIYDVRGRLVTTLREGVHEAGDYSIEWDRRGHRGGPVASGIYLLHLDAGGARATQKLPLLNP